MVEPKVAEFLGFEMSVNEQGKRCISIDFRNILGEEKRTIPIPMGVISEDRPPKQSGFDI